MNDREHEGRVRFHLLIALQVAVPFRVLELNAMSSLMRDQAVKAWAEHAAGEIASRGDVLQFVGSKKGTTAEVFNALAKGIAALSTLPGGVVFLGHLWCAAHSRGGNPTQDHYCSACLPDAELAQSTEGGPK